MKWEDLAAGLRNWGRWGDDDELGTLNYIDPAAVLRGAGAIRHGEVISLAVNFDAAGPAAGVAGRFNPQHYMTATPLDGPEQAVRRGTWRYLDDHVVMPLQCGTQWDGLSHVYYDDLMYNGFDATECVKSNGTTRLGIEKMRDGIVSRGLLIDVARSRGVPWMQPGEAIGSAEIEDIAAAEGITVESGDVLVIRTGWWAKFLQDRDGAAWWTAGSPGLSAAALPWLHAQEVAAIAFDNGAVEVRPDTENDWETFTYSPVHAVALRDMGMPMGEIWDLERLSAACAQHGQYEFLLAAAPLPFTGAVGSPLNPVAVL
jgi:kynurenine formamidase